MRILTKDLACDLKAINETGAFEGYAAVFGNVDEGRDRIQPGAFKEFAKLRNGKTVTLYMHAFRDPIGVADVYQDSKGLQFKSQLELADPLARRTHTLMKAGIIDAMSIGYDVMDGGQQEADGVRDLTALKLWEISPVTFGMNALARIESVKAATTVATIREFEDFLRDAGGFSKARAKALASGGWNALTRVRDGSGDADGNEDVARVLKSIEKIGGKFFS